MAPFLRSPDEPFPPTSRPGATAVALLTHLQDYPDADAPAAALRAGAPVFRPARLVLKPGELMDRHALALRVPGEQPSRQRPPPKRRRI